MVVDWDRYPVRDGLKTGAIAWVGGLALVFLFLQLAGGGLSWIGSALPISSSTYLWSATHAWAGVFEASPGLVIVAMIPAALLLGSGYVVAANTNRSSGSPTVRGSSIVVGYGALAVGTWIFTVLRVGTLSPTGGSTAGVVQTLFALLVVLLVTAVAFPLAFGALGGAIAGARGH